MQFASDIDAAVARLERRGGLTLATTNGAITPEIVKAGQRRARELRAEAINGLFTALRRNIDAAFTRRLRAQTESTVLTVG